MVDFIKYKDEYVKHYDGKFRFEKILIRKRQSIVLKSMKKYSHNSVLEVGCGLNPFFVEIDNYEFYTIVEPIEKFVQNAKKAADTDRSIIYYTGLIDDPNITSKLQEKEYDFIIVSSLLHEVPDPSILLSVIRRLSNENTVIHFNVPNVFSFHRLLAKEAGLINSIFEKSGTDERFQRYANYDMNSFKEILNTNGFKIIEDGTYFVKLFTSSQIERMYEENIIDLNIIEAFGKMVKYLPDLGCEMYANVSLR